MRESETLVMEMNARQTIEALVVKVQDLKTRLAAFELEKNEPVAVVGLGCRFPGGANGPEAYWNLLESGADAVVSLDERWSLAGSRPSEDTPRWAGLLTGPVDAFDAAFFGISPREAEWLDPQHRLLLEVAWEGLEHAGIPARSLSGSRTGVFIGASTLDYYLLGASEPRERHGAYCTTGNMLSVAAGRLSYTLGLEGPCLTVDTACSSSLVAVHLACRSLRARECDLALAGGVSMILSPQMMENANNTQALSPDGRCRTFDALANGFVRGEGGGLVVLKRLSDARRDGDVVHALLRGSAINQDGRSSGLTAPSVGAQEAVIREALRVAEVSAAAIGYVECHGTGTSLGDPIETEALRTVVGAPRADGSRCLLGAVKTNLGHLEAAAGVAGLIKTVLALRHGRIPGNLNFRTLNPRIRLGGSALALAGETVDWQRGTQPRFAGVSSFGMSGTNAHVVLQEAPLEEAPLEEPPAGQAAIAAAVPPARLLVLSAATPAALDELTARMGEYLEKRPGESLRDVAFSLATTRSPMEHRLAMVATSGGVGNAVRGAASAARGKTTFRFTGQPAHTAGMGMGSSRDWAAFREAFDRCVDLFDRQSGGSLRAAMWGPAVMEPRDETHLEPALFTIEFALCALWRSWGIQPDVVTGWGVGEICAACVAGVFSPGDAVRLVAVRGRAEQLEEVAKSISYREPSLTLAVGPGKSERVTESGYWARRMREPVPCADCENPLDAFGAGTVIGIGPSFGDDEAISGMLRTLGAFWVQGGEVDWAGVFPEGGRRVALPTYPWQRQRHWLSAPKPRLHLTGHPLLGLPLSLSTEKNTRIWETSLDLKRLPWLQDQASPGSAVLPVACYVEMALAAGGGFPLEISRMSLAEPLVLSGDAPVRIQMVVTGDEFQIASRPDDASVWTPHARGTLRCGPAIRAQAWARGEQARTQVHLPADAGSCLPYAFHPALLDACIQVMTRDRRLGSPVAIASMRFYESPSADLWCLARDVPGAAAEATRRTLEMQIQDSAGRVLADIGGFELQDTPGALPSGRDNPFLELTWEAAPVPAAKAKAGSWLLAGGEPDLRLALRNAIEGCGHGVIDTLQAAAPAAVVHFGGAESLSETVRTLARAGFRDAPKLWIVTRGAQASAGGMISLDDAPSLGLARVIAIEHPEFQCASIDLDSARPENEVQSLLAELLAEDPEDEVAFRDGRRQVARMVRGLQTRASSQPGVAVRSDSAYLVTGGLGGMGLGAAGWLAQKGAGHVVLVGRSGADTEERQSAIRVMEANGARVTVVRADVANRPRMQLALSEIAAAGFPLRGVVHSAGVSDDGVLLEQTPERFHAVMTPKAEGALHLDALTRGLPLDFFVTFSSAAGLLGSPGQGNDAAANTFLDALAHRRRAEGLPALSIAWGIFSETGMAARALRTLTPGEGLDALGELLAAGGPPNIAVLPLDIRRWVGFFPAMASSRRLSRLTSEPAPVRRAGDRELAKRLAEAESQTRVQLLIGFLRAQVSQVLLLPEDGLDERAHLPDLGMDSLTSMELRGRIEGALGIELSATTLWTYPDISSLARALSSGFADLPEAGTHPPDASGTVAVGEMPVPELMSLLDSLLAQGSEER